MCPPLLCCFPLLPKFSSMLYVSIDRSAGKKGIYRQKARLERQAGDRSKIYKNNIALKKGIRKALERVRLA